MANVASAVRGDSAQWFDLFRMVRDGKQFVTVSRGDTSGLVPADVHAQSPPATSGDEVDVSVGDQATAAMEIDNRQGLPLTTVNVTVAGHAVPMTGELGAAGGTGTLPSASDFAPGWHSGMASS